ncbi:MAG: hypothetical protein WBW53_02810 [Terriglobales bacterium]
MLVPVLGMPAMACVNSSDGMDCMRRCMRLSMAAHEAGPAMQCHHAMAAGASQSESSQVSLRASDNGCQDHNCCCCTTIPEWAQPASGLLASIGLLIETAQPPQSAQLRSIDIFRHDSARAPPRS